MKTAMQELVEELIILRGFGIKISDEYIAGLIEKEKEHIIDAYCEGFQQGSEGNRIMSEEYYNQTYNQNK